MTDPKLEQAKAAADRINDWDGADHFDDCPSRAHEFHDCSCPDTDEGEDACAALVESECDCYLGAMRDCREAIRTVLAALAQSEAEVQRVNDKAIEEVRDEIMRRKQAEEKLAEAMKALRDLTPGGSEFQTVQECVGYIRRERDDRWESLKRFKSRGDKAEAALASADASIARNRLDRDRWRARAHRSALDGVR